MTHSMFVFMSIVSRLRAAPLGLASPVVTVLGPTSVNVTWSKFSTIKNKLEMLGVYSTQVSLISLR